MRIWIHSSEKEFKNSFLRPAAPLDVTSTVKRLREEEAGEANTPASKETSCNFLKIHFWIVFNMKVRDQLGFLLLPRYNSDQSKSN